MKMVDEHNGFKVNQLVIDQSNVARIIYIEIDDDLSEKYERDIHYVRLGLINSEGIEFANCTTTTLLLKKLKNLKFE